jgi:hypothetical protein
VPVLEPVIVPDPLVPAVPLVEEPAVPVVPEVLLVELVVLPVLAEVELDPPCPAAPPLDVVLSSPPHAATDATRNARTDATWTRFARLIRSSSVIDSWA